MSLPEKRQISILLAAPRGFCAGVDRAIQIVEQAIRKWGAPVYVRHEIAEALTHGLWRHADWVTPNAFELGYLTGGSIDGLSAALRAAQGVGKPVLCSSIPTALGLGNLFAAPAGDWFCETERTPRAPKGAGDLLTALFVARRVRGDAPAMALEAEEPDLAVAAPERLEAVEHLLRVVKHRGRGIERERAVRNDARIEPAPLAVVVDHRHVVGEGPAEDQLAVLRPRLPRRGEVKRQCRLRGHGACRRGRRPSFGVDRTQSRHAGG